MLEYRTLLDEVFPKPNFSEETLEGLKFLKQHHTGHVDYEKLEDPLGRHRGQAIEVLNGVSLACNIPDYVLKKNPPFIYGNGVTVLPNNSGWGENISIGDGSYVGEYVKIEDDVKIGKFCYISHFTTIEAGTTIPDFTRLPFFLDGTIPDPDSLQFSEGRLLITKDGSVFQLFYGDRKKGFQVNPNNVEREKKFIGSIEDFVLFQLAQVA